ncbi:hypothetical protein KGF54_002825 [Candida jiufengensis]|uniref:uncharacterized protein n=1 Tax=Candida jiufengensis TaxID=497108 RepID=UPI0022248938|nr:uncharacterized protein KGF54_002825 [Candida jiufengensis]KAI5953453.1 hypothetical protein KGF54_002825 [Candida jiufengensis]
MSGLLATSLYISNISIFTIWSYLFIFNKNLISKYYSSYQQIIPKSQINEFINSKLRNEKSLNILSIDMSNDEEEEEEEIIHFQPKLQSHQQQKNTNNDYGNIIIGIIFSVTLSLSIGLIILMMCELGNYIDHDTRFGLFKFTIDTLMLLLVLVIPFCSINLLINQNLAPIKINNTRKVMTVVIYALWFLVLHKCGDLTQNFNPRSSLQSNTRNIVERKINEISIVGITILAILSGIGSTSTPYRTIPFEQIWKKYILKQGQDSFYNNDSKTSDIQTVDINSAIQNYNNTSNLLSKRKSELSKLELSNGGTIYNLPQQNLSSDNFLTTKSQTSKKLGSLIHKVQSFANLPLKGQSEEEELKQEIQSLENLKKSMYNDLSKLIFKYYQNSQDNLNQSKLFEKFISIGNTVLSIYCVYRIINVFLIKLPLLYIYGEDSDYDIHSEIIDVENDTPTSKDALAITISKVIISIYKNIPISESQLVNQLSFILSGSLFICSFTNVLTTFKSFSKVFHISSSSKDHELKFAKNWLKHLLIAELVGVYIIATALLIRTNLPENLSNQISKILSLSGSSLKNNNTSIKEVMFIENWFDKIFALSCFITIIFLVIKKFIDDDDNLDLNSRDTFDEESFLESREEYKLA